MTRSLLTEIKQTRPFEAPEVEAHLNLARTAEMLRQALIDTVRPAGLSPNAYNALRILRGTGSKGLTCGEVAERMITRDPDITRLIDRLVRRDFVSRTRGENDRRLVRLRISPEGRRPLAKLDKPILEMNRRCLGHLGEERLGQLIELLEAARERPA